MGFAVRFLAEVAGDDQRGRRPAERAPQPAHGVDAGGVVGQPQIGDDEIDAAVVERRHRAAALPAVTTVAPHASNSATIAATTAVVVVDDDHAPPRQVQVAAAAAAARSRRRRAARRSGRGRARAAPATREARAAAGHASRFQRMAQQRGQPAHDGQPESQAAPRRVRAHPRRGLNELVEDPVAIVPARSRCRCRRRRCARRRRRAGRRATRRRPACRRARWRRSCARCARAGPGRLHRERRRRDPQHQSGRRRLRREVGGDAREQRRQRHRADARASARRRRGATGRAVARTVPPAPRPTRGCSRPAGRRRSSRVRAASAAAKSPSACSGWRRSWLAAARNWLLARFAVSAAARASSAARVCACSSPMRSTFSYRIASERGEHVVELVAERRARSRARRPSRAR